MARSPCLRSSGLREHLNRGSSTAHPHRKNRLRTLLVRNGFPFWATLLLARLHEVRNPHLLSQASAPDAWESTHII